MAAVEITYKTTVINLNAGETATLHTNGTRMTDDLIVKSNETSYDEYEGEVRVS